MERFEIEQIKSLLDQNTFRDFAKEFIQLRKDQGHKLGYSDIARRGGFAARSFPREVLTGKKELTAISLPKFIKGLGLKGEIAEYFRNLAETSFSKDEKFRQAFLKRQSNLRGRILRKADPTQQDERKAIFLSEHLPLIYAALGEGPKGAKLEEITSRTGLPDSRVKEGLKTLTENQLVISENEKYRATDNHIHIQKSGDLINFKRFFLASTRRAQFAAEQRFDSDSALFFAGAFSVKAERLKNLKSELSELLSRYVENNETTTGDKVVSLCCAQF